MVLTDYKWKRRDEYRREGDHWKSKAETDIPAPGETLQVYPKDFRLILPESKTSLLVLKSYVELFDCTWQRWQEDPFSGVLVTGEPGTGKTNWIIYVLIQLLVRKMEVIVWTYKGETHVLYGNIVYQVGKDASLPSPVDASKTLCIWHLVDWDDKTNCPKSWTKQRRGAWWGMPLWSEKDLSKGLRLQRRYQDRITRIESILSGLVSTPGAFLKAARIAQDQTPRGQSECRSVWAERILDAMALSNIATYGYSPRDVYEETFQPGSLSPDTSAALDGFQFDDIKNLNQLSTITSSESGLKERLSHVLFALDISRNVSYSENRDSFTLRPKSHCIQDRLAEHIMRLQDTEAHL